jgi:ADP-L-glycero-D-manno-heptose 6-epimerase
MKIITGGAGFIGSAICWRLNSLGFNDIIIVDSDIEGTKKNNLQELKYSEFIDKDTFVNRIDEFSGKADILYHMGACTSTTETDMDYLMKNNFEYSKHLAEWAIRNKVRFIYASSGATYGDGSLGFDDDHSLIPKLKPLNKYGLSKQMFDLWLIENNLIDKVVGLKYFNVFGPNEYHKGEMRSMVCKQYNQILKAGKMKLFKSYKAEYKDGEQKRDFIYVKDAVEMTVFFEGNKNISGIFNIGSGNAYTWNSLAHSIFKAMNLEPWIEYVDIPDNIKNQYQYYSCADISKLREAGFKKEITELEHAVEDYVVNYLSPNKYLTLSNQII